MTTDPTGSILEEKSASYLELFFDLVFVFAITQVAALLREEPTFAGFGKGVLILVMLWWTWSIYTWTTNWTGTDRFGIRLSLIVAMGASLVMAVAVPSAFGSGGMWFATPYALVRLAAAAIYWVGARTNAAQMAAFKTFFPLSSLTLAIVVVGAFFDGRMRIAIWIVALIVDFVSASAAGRETWDIDPGHFAERNGLFIIISLGESIVAIGIGASHSELSFELVTTLGLAFAAAAALWWSYFDRATRAAERHLKSLTGRERGRFARDAYSILHMPIVIGIVLFAVGAEEVVAHPHEPLESIFAFALAVGAGLVLLAVVAAAHRAIRRIPVERFVAAGLLVLLAIVGKEIRADYTMGLVVVIIVAALWREHTHSWSIADRQDSPTEESGSQSQLQ